MKNSEALAIINEIEEAASVETWTYNGIHVWPVIRIDLAYRLLSGDDKETKTNRINNIVYLLMRFYKIIIKLNSYVLLVFFDYKSLKKRKGQADAAFVTTANSFDNIKGTWFDRYCDPYISSYRKLSRSTLILSPFTTRIRDNSSSIQLFYIQYLWAFITGITKTFFNKNKIRHLISQGKGFQKYVDLLKKHDLNVNPLPLDIFIKINTIEKLSRIFEKSLRKMDAKSVFSVCYYGVYGMSLNPAAFRLGIPSSDIQHGVVLTNPAYVSFNKTPAEGYELLPKYFMVWSCSEKNEIEKWTTKVLNYHKPIIAGNQYLQWFMENREKTFFKTEDNQFKNWREKYQYIGLITLQTEFNIIDRIKKTIGEYENVMWLVRLHPAMDKAERRSIKKALTSSSFSNLEIELACDLPLYFLLQNIDLHMTYSSAAVRESATLGIPSYIMSQYGCELFEEEMKKGVASFYNDKIDWEWVKKSKNMKNYLSIPIDNVISMIN